MQRSCKLSWLEWLDEKALIRRRFWLTWFTGDKQVDYWHLKPKMFNSLETSEFPAQMDSNAENVSIWWRRHEPNVCE